MEAIEEAILHIGSLDPRELVDVNVNATERRLDSHAVSTGQWQANLYPRVGTDEHGHIEALRSAGREQATRHAIGFVENVSHRPPRLR